MIGQKGIPATMGGVERHVEELSTRLVRHGFRVTVYTRPWYTPTRGRFRGADLVSLPSLHTKHGDAITHTFLATVHAIRSSANVLHYHGVGPALLAWMPRLFAPEKRVVVTFHCIDRHHEKWGVVSRLMLRVGELAACLFAHETIAVSRTLQHYAENTYRTRVRYIPNGLTTFPPARIATVRALGLEPGAYVLVVTRFVRHKGVHTVLAAWERAACRPAFRNLSLVLVGGSAFTDMYTDDIRSYAGRLERVRLLGERDGQTLASLYRYARAFVHASTSEGLPIVVLEAMAQSVPVLASDIPEHMELVRDHAWSFTSGDPVALATTLAGIVAHPEKARHLADETRRWVNKNFSWEDISIETERVYHGMFSSRTHAIRLVHE